MATLGEILLQRRRALGMLQKHVAAQVEICQSQLSAVETGKSDISASRLMRIITVLGGRIAWDKAAERSQNGKRP